MKRKTLLLTIVLSLCLTLVLGFGSSALAAQSKIDVIYDGSPITFDVQPQSQNGRTMVPFRQIFETLGYDVEWNEAAKTVTAKSKEGSDVITLTLGSTNITMNEKTVHSDVPPITKNNRTLVPVRIISELSGKDVLWDDYGPAVMIYSKLGEDATPQVQSSNQGITIAEGTLYFGDHNRKSATTTLSQINLKTGEISKTNLIDPEMSNLQWTGKEVFVEGAENLYLYSPANGTVRTLAFQPESWIYNTCFYEGAIYGAHCYNLPSNQKAVHSKDFAKLDITNQKVNLLNNNMSAGIDYIIYDGRIFSEGMIEDMSTGKMSYIDDIFRQKPKNKQLSVRAQAVHGDCYYCAYMVFDYSTWDEKIYIARYNYKTGETKQLPPLPDRDISAMAITDNSIYYQTCYNDFFRTDINGNHPVRIGACQTLSNVFTIYDNQIIYMDFEYDSGAGRIRALNTNGTNHRTLYEMPNGYLHPLFENETLIALPQ